MLERVVVALPVAGHAGERVDVGADRQFFHFALPGRVGIDPLSFCLRDGLGGVAARLRGLALREQIGELVARPFQPLDDRFGIREVLRCLLDLFATPVLLAADGFERFLDEIVLVWLDALLRLWGL